MVESLNGANIRTEKEEKAQKDSIRWPVQKGRVTGQGRKRGRGFGGCLGGDLDLTDNRQASSVAPDCVSVCMVVVKKRC